MDGQKQVVSLRTVCMLADGIRFYCNSATSLTSSLATMAARRASWNEIDGMLYILASKWWTDEGNLVDISRELLYEKHPDLAKEIIRSGVGYLTIFMSYIMLEIIRNAAETVSLKNLDSHALYEAAKSFSLTVDDVDPYSFEGKKIRSVSNYFIV